MQKTLKMNNSNSTLPSPRTLLTSIITTLTSSSRSTIANPGQQQIRPKPGTDPAIDANIPKNPLKCLSTSQRALLSTLHVLLPTGVLLQSLDLLDRGLIVKIIQKTPVGGPSVSEETKGQSAIPPQTYLHIHEGMGASTSQARVNASTQQQFASSEYASSQGVQPGQANMAKAKNVVYQVRSSQTPKSRFRDVKFVDAGRLTYTVRLDSWNCSCAAFAFESFPGHSFSSGRKPWLGFESVEGMAGNAVWNGDDGDDGDDGGWEFGGLSFDGMELCGNGPVGGKVPVCKHLLACLLVERWEILDGYVEKRSVGPEEMAGLGGEG